MRNLLNKAIQHLSTTSCTEQELRTHLEKNIETHADRQEMEAAITYLQEQYILNDIRLAEQVAWRFSHKGNNFIRQTLQQKGVSEPVIEQSLSSLDAEYQRALKEASKNQQRLKNSKNNLMRFLNGRRFSGSTIHDVINHLLPEKRVCCA